MRRVEESRGRGEPRGWLTGSRGHGGPGRRQRLAGGSWWPEVTRMDVGLREAPDSLDLVGYEQGATATTLARRRPRGEELREAVNGATTGSLGRRRHGMDREELSATGGKEGGSGWWIFLDRE